MQVIKKVLIKQVLTKQTKDNLIEGYKRDKIQLERECEQLLFEQRKLTHKQKASKHEIIKRFHQEIENRKDKIQVIEFKIEQLALLELGSEIIEKEVDAIVEVEVGNKWSELKQRTSIVIQDDILIRIDEDRKSTRLNSSHASTAYAV